MKKYYFLFTPLQTITIIVMVFLMRDMSIRCRKSYQDGIEDGKVIKTNNMQYIYQRGFDLGRLFPDNGQELNVTNLAVFVNLPQ